MHARILIAGIGNIFFGDDAFGVEVARRLAQHPLPDTVRVVDFGIRGLDLTYALLDPYEAVILVDAVPRGGSVGTVYVLEPELGPAERARRGGRTALDGSRKSAADGSRAGQHDRARLARWLRARTDGSRTTSMQMEMSAPVQAAVDEAITVIQSLVSQILTNGS